MSSYVQGKKTTITGSEKNLSTWMYRLEENGLMVRETVIDSGKNDDTVVEIVQLSDLHINYVNEKDLQDEELAYTSQCRVWNANGACVPAIEKAMKYAIEYDQTVVTGDTLDYLSDGAIELMKQCIWDVDPEALIALGGHDLAKQMQTKRPEKTSLEERRNILRKAWKHDIFYTSKLIKDKVLVVAMDNGNHEYYEEQIDKLARDIALAREKNYVILVFQHEAICTGYPEDSKKRAFRVYDGEYENFYSDYIGYDLSEDTPTTRVYKLLTENADVIRGLFCGHHHSAFYTEVKGSYIDENGFRRHKNIPQPILSPSAYDDYAGHVMKITVI